GEHAFRRIGVMRATGRVDVVIAAVPAEVHRVDPALEPDLDFEAALFRYPDVPFLQLVLRPAAVNHGHLAGRQEHRLAAVPVHLILEEEVRGQALALRRENAHDLVLAVFAGPDLLLEGEAAGGRLAVNIEDRHLDGNGGANVEEHRHFTAEAEVL